MYERGKIYKITCDGTDLTYYGSTCSTLTKRLNGHKVEFKSWEKDKKKSYTTSFELFEIGEPIITLVEDVKCERKEQLLAKERWYIENNECVNKIVPGRTLKEWRLDNKEILDEKEKEYRSDNKEKIAKFRKEYYANNKEKTKEYYANNVVTIKEYQQEYRSDNKEKLKEKTKEYRDDNKEKIKEYRIVNKEKIKASSSQPWKCECCDKTIRLGSRFSHMKAAKHILKSQPIVNVT